MDTTTPPVRLADRHHYALCDYVVPSAMLAVAVVVTCNVSNLSGTASRRKRDSKGGGHHLHNMP